MLKVAAARIGVPFETYQSLTSSGLKWCGGCREWHILDDFGRDANRASGIAATCLTSRRVPAREGAPSLVQRREQRALGRSWCRGCEEWLPAVDVTEQGACKPCVNAEYRQRYAANPEPIRQRVYARKRGLEPIPVWWALDRIEAFGGLCAYGCGDPGDTWDHIWPVSRGGQSTTGNLVPASRSCNSSKHARNPWPWVVKGFDAFPQQWGDISALALEHNTDDWFEEVA